MTIEEEAWEAFEAVRDPFDAQEPTPLAELATAIIRITKWLHRGGLEGRLGVDDLDGLVLAAMELDYLASRAAALREAAFRDEPACPEFLTAIELLKARSRE